MAKNHKAQVRRADRRHKANPHLHENSALANAEAERGRSGASGTHQGGVRGQRTRKGAKNAAIREFRE
ncbi:MAG: hypothetical protein ABIR91_05420 [Candidatus Saccharimonadales bacterium]